MVLGKLDSHIGKMQSYPYHTPFTKVNSKWIKDSIISPEAIKILEEKVMKKMSLTSVFVMMFWI